MKILALDSCASFKLYTLIFFCYSIVLVSNNYPNIFDNPSGFSDQIQYYKIFLSAPQFSVSDQVASNQAQRFFFIYIWGVISELFQIKEHYHLLFTIIITIIHFFIIIFFLKILNHLKIEKQKIFFFIAIIIFNPYIIRSSLYAPLMINDIIFILGTLLICFYFLNLKIKYLLIGICICALSRQTSMTIIPALIFFMFFNIKKTNIFIILAIFLNIFFFLLTKNISNEFSNYDNNNLITSLTGFFINNYSFTEFLYFLAEIFIGNFMIGLLIIILLLNFRNVFKNIDYKAITILLFALGIFSQPILGGPIFSEGNLTRLTILALPSFLIFFSIILKDYNFNSITSPTSLTLLILSSLHHNYSKIPMIVNYEYFLIIVLIFLIKIFFIFKYEKN